MCVFICTRCVRNKDNNNNRVEFGGGGGSNKNKCLIHYSYKAPA